jgi:integrase
MQTQDVNWNDPALERWFNTIPNKSTAYNYRTAFRSYAEFTGMTATQLIEEADEDKKLPVLKRKDIILQRLTKFYEWLTTEAPIVSRGSTKHKSHQVIGQGITPKSATMRVNAIRSFYATFGFTVKLKGRNKLRQGKVKNKRMIVDAEQVKTLVQHARSIRDRAIILINFQGGMDVSTLCSLNYEDIAQIESGEYPLKLELYRKKADVEYYTFIGHDAINALKAYVADQKARGTEWKPDSPLFTKERIATAERITPNLVQNMLKDLAIKTGLVKKDNGKDFNILGSHALRESFSSIMLNSGVPKPIVDFWLGHTVNGTDEAYMIVQFERAKEMYSKREHLLSISASTEKEEELRKIKDSILEIVVDKEDLKAEVNDLKEKLTNALTYINVLIEEKDQAQRREAQNDFNKLIDELNKTNPVPKKK